MSMHTPGDKQCKGCDGLASLHEGCKKVPKGVVHTIEETLGQEPSLWRRCDACGVKPRGEDLHENWHLYGEVEVEELYDPREGDFL